ncbi:MAG: hypothetical protein ACTSQI_05335 [Candidatus Helarchaeota archaeon]
MDSLLDPLMSANFTLWICITILILYIAIFSFRGARSLQTTIDQSQKKNLRRWGYFFLLLTISNILILTWRFAFSNGIITDILERSANALFYCACFIKVVDIEKSLIESDSFPRYTRYYFSSIVCITILINIIVPPRSLKIISPWQITFLLIVTIGYSVFPIIYFYVSRKSSGKVRFDALKVSIGAIFLALGYLFRPENLIAYYGMSNFIDTVINLFYLTAPIDIVVGVLLIFDSYRRLE